jgi:hypothetical protein
VIWTGLPLMLSDFRAAMLPSHTAPRLQAVLRRAKA